MPRLNYRLSKNISLYAILFLALFLRLYRLDILSLFGDEIDVGYHAWSLFTTGRDYYGQLLPSYIHSLAEWRAPLLMYVTAPFVGLLGPSLWSVRLPVVLLGVSNVYLIYLLTNLLFEQSLRLHLKNKVYEISLGHLAALIMTLTPWHLHYSRAAFEVTLLLTLLLLGTYLFLKNSRFFLLPFVLTFYTYSTANLFTPLLLLSLFFIYRPKPSFFIAKNLPFTITSLLLLLPIGYQLAFGQAAGRFQYISIFADPKISENIILNRTEPWVNQNEEVVFHNKPLAYLSTFGTQYLQALSPQFLFIHGDPFFRHSISRFGELLWVTAPFLYLGLASLLSNPTKSTKLVLTWLLLAPIPSALTKDGGEHATRLFILLPPLIILISLGILKLNQLKLNLRLLALSCLFLATILNFALFAHRYLVHYPAQSYVLWHGGYEQIMSKLKPQLAKADKIYLNSTYQPSLLPFVFYTQYHPKEFHQTFTTSAPDENLLPWFTGFQLSDKYYFGQAKTGTNLAETLGQNDLYLAAQGREIPGDWDWAVNPPAGLAAIAQVKDPLNQPLFTLIQVE